jgi:very-short-patch-repair endonuclease/predicted transcriptional regulator of viral defense system
MARETNLDHQIGGKRCSRDLGREVAELAERQHGVVARRQLFAIGVSRRAIEGRLAAGTLHPLHRGVYAVGHLKLSSDGRWMAAALAGGPDAVVSHCAAGAVWGLRPWRGRAEVTVPSYRRERAGIKFFRSHLPEDEVTTVRGVPVTTVPRTIFDLAAVRERRDVERAIEEAEYRRLTDPLSLEALLTRYPRRRGSRTIRAILAAGRIGSGITRSELEERFLAFVQEVRLPAPRTNVPLNIAGDFIEADCVWRPQRLVVELDGHAAHRSVRAFERDRGRDRALQAAGWQVVRLTWRQLQGDRKQLAADLGRLLGRRSR